MISLPFLKYSISVFLNIGSPTFCFQAVVKQMVSFIALKSLPFKNSDNKFLIGRGFI